MHGYLNNTEEGNAGKAINITQTMAGHAMCYKITSLFGCAHGHAAILCDEVLYPWMVQNAEKCVDGRGVKYLTGTLDEIGKTLGAFDAMSGAERLMEIFDFLELSIPVATDELYSELKDSVNLVRLKNHPIDLDEETIDALYHEMLR